MKGDCFTILFDIFPEYQYIILDVVYSELSKNPQTKTFIDNISKFMTSKIKLIEFKPLGNVMKEYAQLLRTFGKGESACMIYCNNNNDVLGSSNLRDIKDYCESHSITYLTTLDFLYYAYIRKKLTLQECDTFIQQVNSKGSIIPIVDISRYTCSVIN